MPRTGRARRAPQARRHEAGRLRRRRRHHHGLIAGAVATGATTPLDVVKTRVLQRVREAVLRRRRRGGVARLPPASRASKPSSPASAPRLLQRHQLRHIFFCFFEQLRVVFGAQEQGLRSEARARGARRRGEGGLMESSRYVASAAAEPGAGRRRWGMARVYTNPDRRQMRHGGERRARVAKNAKAVTPRSERRNVSFRRRTRSCLFWKARAERSTKGRYLVRRLLTFSCL